MPDMEVSMKNSTENPKLKTKMKQPLPRKKVVYDTDAMKLEVQARNRANAAKSRAVHLATPVLVGNPA